ncbi:hypothetical protein GGS20DRAFT_494750 [Poronia punctata]|nr:hypothetical protein GGS20DRAFT_494750 [Poronia punctata]
MVFLTHPRNSLKLLSRINQGPLTNSETEKLYDRITSSFRKTLDQEYLGTEVIATTSTDTEPESKSSVATAAATTAQPPTHDHLPHTARHIGAILSNPLFSRPPNTDRTPLVLTRRGKNPADVFDSAVSRGLMTPLRATGFLATVRSQILAESSEDVSKRMAGSGAGVRVLRWLRSSGNEGGLDFLKHPALVKLLTQFLFAEGRQGVPWDWLERLASSHAPGPGLAGPDMSCLLNAIVNESGQLSTDGKANLDGSYEALARARDMFPDESVAAYKAIKHVWSELTWMSTVKAPTHPKPSESLFESFVDIGRPLGLPLELAHLDLHHPTKPSHSAAIKYLQPREQLFKEFPSMEQRTQQQLLCLVVDAADGLKHAGKQNQWLVRLGTSLMQRLNLGVLDVLAWNSFRYKRVSE